MDEESTKAEYYLGKDAEDFIESELGRYIIGRIEQERAELVAKLIATPARANRRITQLQNEIWRCDTFKGWLADMVVRGKQALHQLETEE